MLLGNKNMTTLAALIQGCSALDDLPLDPARSEYQIECPLDPRFPATGLFLCDSRNLFTLASGTLRRYDLQPLADSQSSVGAAASLGLILLEDATRADIHPV